MADGYGAATVYDSGRLEVGDGQTVAWTQSANPSGLPVVVLHGGPGSGSAASTRRFFDPARWRIVQLDQRGCGESRPHASDVDLAANTTPRLVGDVDRLREHLGVESWVVFGASWGSVLGLAYAQAHRDRVDGLLLAGVAVGRRTEIDWMYRGGLGRFFPREWRRFLAAVGAAAEDDDPVASYRDVLEGRDEALRSRAARAWTEWDWATSSVDPGPLAGRWAEDRFQLARARLCAHYFVNDLWLEDGALVEGARALSGTPGILVNGRLDLQAPLSSAWDLHEAWPGSKLIVVSGAGHSSGDPGMEAAIVAGATELADRAG